MSPQTLSRDALALRTLQQWGNRSSSAVRHRTIEKTLAILFWTHLERESLVKDGVERFLVNLCVKLLLLVREHKDLDVGVGRAAAVHGEKVGCLQDPNGELRKRNKGNVLSMKLARIFPRDIVATSEKQVPVLALFSWKS